MQISTDRAFLERMNDVVLIFARLERHLTSSGAGRADCCRAEPHRHAHVSRARSCMVHKPFLDQNGLWKMFDEETLRLLSLTK